MSATAIPQGRAIEPPPTRKADLPDLYPAGRVCTRPGCGTILSVYNAGPRCWPCGGYDTVDLNATGSVLAELLSEAP